MEKLSYDLREKFYTEEFYAEEVNDESDVRLTNADLMSEGADISSVDDDFLSALAEFPTISKRIKKCRDGCPNCERLPCHTCKKCKGKRRCELRVCKVYDKMRRAARKDVNTRCPNCNRNYYNKQNLERHKKTKSCEGDLDYAGRKNMKYQEGLLGKTFFK